MSSDRQESHEHFLFTFYWIVLSLILIGLFFGALYVSLELRLDFLLTCALLAGGSVLLVLISWWISGQKWGIWMLNKMAGKKLFGLEEGEDTVEN